MSDFLAANGREATFESWIAMLHPENVRLDHRMTLQDSSWLQLWQEMNRGRETTAPRRARSPPDDHGSGVGIDDVQARDPTESHQLPGEISDNVIVAEEEEHGDGATPAPASPSQSRRPSRLSQRSEQQLPRVPEGERGESWDEESSGSLDSESPALARARQWRAARDADENEQMQYI